MLLDQSLGRLTKPLEQREVLELVCTEDFQHLNILFVAQILDKVAHILGNNADIASLVVKGTGNPRGSEYGYAGTALDEEGPLVGIGCGEISTRPTERGNVRLTVPVHLSDCARLNTEVGSSHRLGQREVCRVGDADLTTSSVEWLLSKHFVGELQLGLLVARAAAGDLLLNRTWLGALEDVLLLLRNGIENLRGDTEILGKDGFWCARDPIGKQEG
jgi:hypothetical protein